MNSNCQFGAKGQNFFLQIFICILDTARTTATNDVECYCTLYKIIIQPCKKENMLRCVKFMQDSLKTFVLIKEHSEWIYYEK